LGQHWAISKSFADLKGNFIFLLGFAAGYPDLPKIQTFNP
jgi:hypothetical protein